MGPVSDKGGKSTATAHTSVGWWPAPERPWLCVIVVVDLTVVTRDLSSLSVFLRVVGGGGSDGDVAPTSTGDTEADGYGRACASCLGVVAAAEAAGVGVSSKGEGAIRPHIPWCGMPTASLVSGPRRAGRACNSGVVVAVIVVVVVSDPELQGDGGYTEEDTHTARRNAAHHTKVRHIAQSMTHLRKERHIYS